ncbi:hypothetical protein ACQPW3_38295 [Actinosynnema sp. CA-248983]
MHEIIAAKRPEVEDLCRVLGVRRLDVFGSAVGDSFDVVSCMRPDPRAHLWDAFGERWSDHAPVTVTHA